MPDSTVFGEGHARSDDATVHGEGRVRTNLAVHHLMAAALFARNTAALEQRHAGQPFAAFFEEIMWSVSSCIVMSVAAVEAHFNERMAELGADHTFLSLIER